MNTVLDTCSAINLRNGGALETILSLRSRTFLVGPIVLDECGEDRARFEELVANGKLALVDEESIPASAYLSLLEKYGLGPGETECLAIAKAIDCAVCSDDRAARQVVLAEIGSSRLTGSIGLLKESVRDGLMSPLQAWTCFEQMTALGAFLPDVARHFFDQ